MNNLTRLLLRHLFKHIANTLNFVKIQPLVFEIFLATESHKTHTHTWWNNGPFFLYCQTSILVTEGEHIKLSTVFLCYFCHWHRHRQTHRCTCTHTHTHTHTNTHTHMHTHMHKHTWWNNSPFLLNAAKPVYWLQKNTQSYPLFFCIISVTSTEL